MGVLSHLDSNLPREKAVQTLHMPKSWILAQEVGIIRYRAIPRSLLHGRPHHTYPTIKLACTSLSIPSLVYWELSSLFFSLFFIVVSSTDVPHFPPTPPLPNPHPTPSLLSVSVGYAYMHVVLWLQNSQSFVRMHPMI